MRHPRAGGALPVAAAPWRPWAVSHPRHPREGGLSPHGDGARSALDAGRDAFGFCADAAPRPRAHRTAREAAAGGGGGVEPRRAVSWPRGAVQPRAAGVSRIASHRAAYAEVRSRRPLPSLAPPSGPRQPRPPTPRLPTCAPAPPLSPPPRGSPRDPREKSLDRYAPSTADLREEIEQQMQMLSAEYGDILQTS